MAGRFPLYTYADVLGPIIAALKRRGLDVVRAVDQFPEGTDDEVHFEYAAREGRVLVTADEDQELCAIRWFVEGRPFRGLITRERELTPRNSTNLRSFREEHGKRPVLGIEEDEIEGHLESRFSGSSPRRRHGMGKVAADAIVDLDVEMEEAQGALAKYVREALKGPIVITTCGRPVAFLTRVKGIDLEDLSMSTNRKFIEIIESSRESARKHGTIPMAEIERELDIESSRKHKAARKSRRKPAQCIRDGS